MSESTDFNGNIDRFSGFANLYDRYRPAPPAILGEILIQLAGGTRPQCVVDLGSGTGLSTRYWADKAEYVIGVEPTADMRREAEAQTRGRNVSYREGFSHETGLADQSADIITCSQSLHWMDPQSTFREARRIARPGGVFAAFDYDWPPTTGSWQADAAFVTCLQHARALEQDLAVARNVRQWDKNQHLARMEASDCFRHTREIVVHHTDFGNAERFVGLLLSQGGVMSLLKRGVTEEQIGVDRFRDVADHHLGRQERVWYWSSRVRFGIV